MNSKEMIELIEERIKELKADIKEFTIMELEATTEKDKFRYGMKLAQTKDTLMVTMEGLENAKKRSSLHDEIKKEIDELMSMPYNEIDFEDIQNILIKMFK